LSLQRALVIDRRSPSLNFVVLVQHLNYTFRNRRFFLEVTINQRSILGRLHLRIVKSWVQLVQNRNVDVDEPSVEVQAHADQLLLEELIWT